MTRFLRVVVVAVTLAGVTPVTAGAQEDVAPMVCDRGPITKVLGGNEWLVYSCADDLSLVFVSAEGSPAFPFYFMLTPENGAYTLYGEGTGNQDATKAAHDDILALDSNAIVALIKETRQEL
jgi:hypothetical protein